MQSKALRLLGFVSLLQGGSWFKPHRQFILLSSLKKLNRRSAHSQIDKKQWAGKDGDDLGFNLTWVIQWSNKMHITLL
jgi:hypothetical protein